jgi:hypothetical protein
MICLESAIEVVNSGWRLSSHATGVQDQNMQRPVFVQKFFGSRLYRLERRQIHVDQVDLAVFSLNQP